MSGSFGGTLRIERTTSVDRILSMRRSRSNNVRAGFERLAQSPYRAPTGSHCGTPSHPRRPTRWRSTPLIRPHRDRRRRVGARPAAHAVRLCRRGHRHHGLIENLFPIDREVHPEPCGRRCRRGRINRKHHMKVTRNGGARRVAPAPTCVRVAHDRRRWARRYRFEVQAEIATWRAEPGNIGRRRRVRN
jgi:hypothetical protein